MKIADQNSSDAPLASPTVRFGPIDVDFYEDDEGQLRFTATMDNLLVFDQVPYHVLAMAMVLVDRIVEIELQKDSNDE